MTVKELREALTGLRGDLIVCVAVRGERPEGIDRARIGEAWGADRGRTDAVILETLDSSDTPLWDENGICLTCGDLRDHCTGDREDG